MTPPTENEAGKERYRHIVMFSGGVCSWAAAKRVVERHGKNGVALLFADTRMEDEDLYRFLGEAAANVFGWPSIPPIAALCDLAANGLVATVAPGGFDGQLVVIADGRTPWEVMRDHNCIAKPRMDMCSQELKRELLDAWRNQHCDAAATTLHLGIDWTETHRLEKVKKLCAPWRYEAPMNDRPFMDKDQMIEWLCREGIKPPRLYGLGFPHNNCGGFCIKAGQAHFAHLLRMLPERYAYHEAKEEEMRARVGDYSILRDRTGGQTKTLSLKTLRERIQNRQQIDLLEWGGCGCAID